MRPGTAGIVVLIEHDQPEVEVAGVEAGREPDCLRLRLAPRIYEEGFAVGIAGVPFQPSRRGERLRIVGVFGQHLVVELQCRNSFAVVVQRHRLVQLELDLLGLRFGDASGRCLSGHSRVQRVIDQDHRARQNEEARDNDPDPAPGPEPPARRRLGFDSAGTDGGSGSGSGGSGLVRPQRLELGFDLRQARAVPRHQHVEIVPGQVARVMLTFGILDGTEEELTLIVEIPALVVDRAPAAVTPAHGVGPHAESAVVCATRVAVNWRDRRQNRTPITPMAPVPKTIGTIQMKGNPGGSSRMVGPY